MNLSYLYERLGSATSAFSKNRIWLAVSLVLLVGTVLFTHIYQIDRLPRGLYIDEVSIGLNAATLAESAKDEYGITLPLYFKAFGEYKNPVYIYAAGLMFKLFGNSDSVLRLTSALFFLILLGAAGLLGYLLSGRKLWAAYFGLLGLGFLPQYFTMSRIAFEVISHPAIMAVFLMLLYLSYENTIHEKSPPEPAAKGPRANWLPLATGLVLGLSVYSYSTARLLTPLTLLLVLFIYRQRQFWIKNAYLTGGFVLAYIPWSINFVLNPLSQLSRFGGITYLGNPALTPLQKAGEFFYNYFAYLSPANLIISGDPNLRHSIGYGGIIFTALLFAAVVGIGSVLTQPDMQKRRFDWFLLLSLLAAPLAATLTEEGTPHLLRSSLLGLYIFLLGLIGIRYLLKHRQRLTAVVIFLLLMIEIPNFLWAYFIKYPGPSAEAFGSYGYIRAVEFALNQKPEQVLVSLNKNGGLSYALVDYYNRLIPNPASIPVKLGDMQYQARTCFVYFREDFKDLDQMPRNGFREYKMDGDIAFARCYD